MVKSRAVTTQPFLLPSGCRRCLASGWRGLFYCIRCLSVSGMGSGYAGIGLILLGLVVSGCRLFCRSSAGINGKNRSVSPRGRIRESSMRNEVKRIGNVMDKCKECMYMTEKPPLSICVHSWLELRSNPSTAHGVNEHGNVDHENGSIDEVSRTTHTVLNTARSSGFGASRPLSSAEVEEQGSLRP